MGSREWEIVAKKIIPIYSRSKGRIQGGVAPTLAARDTDWRVELYSQPGKDFPYWCVLLLWFDHLSDEDSYLKTLFPTIFIWRGEIGFITRSLYLFLIFLHNPKFFSTPINRSATNIIHIMLLCGLHMLFDSRKKTKK